MWWVLGVNLALFILYNSKGILLAYDFCVLRLLFYADVCLLICVYPLQRIQSYHTGTTGAVIGQHGLLVFSLTSFGCRLKKIKMMQVEKGLNYIILFKNTHQPIRSDEI